MAELKVTGNLSENWVLFRQNFERYLSEHQKEYPNSETKIALFLNRIGENGLHIFNSIDVTEDDCNDMRKILSLFESKCNSSTLHGSRSKFYKRIQNDREPFESFVGALKSLATECLFGNQADNEIKYRIYLGIRDQDTKEKLVNVDSYTLDYVLMYCRSVELYQSHQKLNGQSVAGQLVIGEDPHNSNSTECVLQGDNQQHALKIPEVSLDGNLLCIDKLVIFVLFSYKILTKGCIISQGRI